jgi:hypothetical protein
LGTIAQAKGIHQSIELFETAHALADLPFKIVVEGANCRLVDDYGEHGRNSQICRNSIYLAQILQGFCRNLLPLSSPIHFPVFTVSLNHNFLKSRRIGNKQHILISLNQPLLLQFAQHPRHRLSG